MLNSQKTIFIILILSVSFTLACGNKPNQDPPTSSCDLYKIFNLQRSQGDFANRISYDTPSDEPAPTFSKAGNITSVTVQAGTRDFGTTHGGKEQQHSMRYIDIVNGKEVKISDKDAIETNKDWTFGIRGFEFYTNGGPYPGSIEVGVIKDKTFDKITKEDAEKVTFVEDSPVLPKSCLPDLRGQLIYTLIASAPDQLLADDPGPYNLPAFSQNYWFTIFPSKPYPTPKPYTYIFRDKKNHWIAKLTFTGVDHFNDPDKKLIFKLKYEIFG